MSPDAAAALALQVTAWLARDAERLGHFLGATGYPAGALRQRLDDPDLLAAILDFVLQDDQWVLEAAAEGGYDPHQILLARRCLPGGDAPHWT